MIACDNYVWVEIVGKGSSWIVFHGYHKETKEEVAVKIINRDKFTKLKMSHFYIEIALLKHFEHPNIVKLVDYSEDAKCVNQNNEIMDVHYLALEYLYQGDLFLYIGRTGPFSEETSRFLFHQLIQGLEYMHKRGISHRDIKPENLMFGSDFTLKIVDFGGATDRPTSKSRTGTFEYMVPEIFKQKEYCWQSADLFAAGVVLFNMMTQHPPFRNATLQDPLYKLLGSNNHESFWNAHSKSMNNSDFFSEDFKVLINVMLAYDPVERPSIAEIKASDWYNGKMPTLEQYQEEMQLRRDLITHFSRHHSGRHDRDAI